MPGQFVGVTLDGIGPLKADLATAAAEAPWVVARALTRAGESGRAAMVKAIKADTGIAAKQVRKQITLDRANRTRPFIRVKIEGRRIPLIAFQAKGPEPSRGKGRGVTYRGPHGRGHLPHAFISTMKSGHRGVYKRRGTRRLPVRELFGPSLPLVFSKQMGVFREAASAAFVKTFVHDFDRWRRSRAA